MRVINSSAQPSGAIETAIGNGDGLDNLVFDEAVFNVPRTIALADTLPLISTSLTLSGPGARLTHAGCAGLFHRGFLNKPS